MAGRGKQKNQAKRQRDLRAGPRQAPKTQVIEAGEAEQGAPAIAGEMPIGGRPSAKESVRQKQREEDRHGGIPIGSDPRE